MGIKVFTYKRNRLDKSRYEDFAIALCNNEPVEAIAKKFNVSIGYVKNYKTYVKALVLKTPIKRNDSRWSKVILKYLEKYTTEASYTPEAKKGPIKYNVKQFAIDICNNEDNTAMAEFYGMSINTIQCYKNFAKAALNSEGSEIEEKIYTTLNKQVKAHIKNLLQITNIIRVLDMFGMVISLDKLGLIQL